MAELLTDEIIIEYLENEYGLQEEPDGPVILELIESAYGSKLNNDSSWAEGHEDLICYYQSTADCYEVYIITHSHNHRDISFENDVYYYLDNAGWSEQIIDTLTNGGDVWCDPNIWDDIEYDFNYELESWYRDYYNDKMAEAEDELLDTGEYTIKEHDE